jgi:hypothetical protein
LGLHGPCDTAVEIVKLGARQHDLLRGFLLNNPRKCVFLGVEAVISMAAPSPPSRRRGSRTPPSPRTGATGGTALAPPARTLGERRMPYLEVGELWAIVVLYVLLMVLW